MACDDLYSASEKGVSLMTLHSAMAGVRAVVVAGLEDGLRHPFTPMGAEDIEKASSPLRGMTRPVSACSSPTAAAPYRGRYQDQARESPFLAELRTTPHVSAARPLHAIPLRPSVSEVYLLRSRSGTPAGAAAPPFLSGPPRTTPQPP